MFLTLREFKHSRLRYLLIATIMTLVAWLVFLLSGLANGLGTGNAAALMNMPADYLIFQTDSRFSMSRSILPMQTLNQVKQVTGVKAAAPLGELTVTTELANSSKLDVTILGIDPTSFLAPPIVEGQMLQAGSGNGVVLDSSAKNDNNLKLGDTLKVTPGGQIVTVVGFTRNQTYSHLPVMFMNIQQWQAIKFPPSTTNAKAQSSDSLSAIAVQMDEATATKVKALAGVEVANRATAVNKLPGYSEESGSVNMILGFLLLIAAFIMAAFFYVIILQKTNQFGILKALGARTNFLVRDTVAQVVLVALAGVVIGGILTYGVAAIMPAKVPFALDSGQLLFYSLVLVVVAMGSSLLSLRYIAKIDPLIAIGRLD
jgi:putative ABC transport system permease protein